MLQPPDASIQDPEQFTDQLFAWVAATGQSSYDESVSQLEHALQAAHLAQMAGDTDAAIASALLHDLGHLLLDEQSGDPEFLTTDREHESVAADWLCGIFGEEVSGPIREHVNAKRYLCYVDSDYASRLSDASTRSLVLQGGPMTSGEAAEFEALPWCKAAVKLRKRDEGAKVAGKFVPGIDSYKAAVMACFAKR